MRVLHVIHSLAPGGAEAVLVDLARVAPHAGLEVAVMPLVQADDDRHDRALRALGVPALPLALSSRWDPHAFRRAHIAARQWGPDIVHTHLKHADLVGAFLARRTGAPMVSTLHVMEDVVGLVPRTKRRLAAAARLSVARRTVAVSEAQRRWYLAAFPSADPASVVTVHNGVVDPRGLEPPDAARRRDLRRSFGVPDDAVLVLQVSLLRPGKGHADLLAALPRLPVGAGVHVALAGDGPLRWELEQAARGLGDRVHFLGYRDDVAALLQACDVVVQPSAADALPTALIQALAAGRPIVANEIGGIPEIVTSDVGVLVPPGDIAALAGALGAVVADPQLRTRLGEAARVRYEQHFSAETWVARLRDLYRQVQTEAKR